MENISYEIKESMQTAIGETVEKAKEVVTDNMASNKKIKDLKTNYRHQSDKTPLTSDFGAKQPDHDHWLSATTDERQGPLLLEDNFAREKVQSCDTF